MFDSIHRNDLSSSHFRNTMPFQLKYISLLTIAFRKRMVKNIQLIIHDPGL